MDENLRREIILDNLDIYFKVENDIITDCYFSGEACAISTSATSIMLKKLVGKTKEEAKELLINYRNMINEKEYDKDLLGELLCYSTIYLQPNRKNCALLPGHAVERLIERFDDGN